MKPLLVGRNIYLRDISTSDAEFVYGLRCNPDLNTYLNPPPSSVVDQRAYIEKYKEASDEYYFIICSKRHEQLGTVRIYDLLPDSFCWGSWIVKSDAPKGVGMESLLLVYDYGFYGLHFSQSHFDVRKGNTRVLELHRRLGAEPTGEDDLNCYFRYTENTYKNTRQRYLRMITR